MGPGGSLVSPPPVEPAVGVSLVDAVSPPEVVSAVAPVSELVPPVVPLAPVGVGGGVEGCTDGGVTGGLAEGGVLVPGVTVVGGTTGLGAVVEVLALGSGF